MSNATEDLERVLEVMGESPELVNLDGTSLKDLESILLLVDWLKLTRPRVVSLNGCEIDDDGAVYLSEHFTTDDSAECLFLSSNNIGNDGARAFASCIGPGNNSTIRYLNFLGNKRIKNRVADELSTSFMESKYVQSICGVWTESYPNSTELSVSDLSVSDSKFLGAELAKGASMLRSLELYGGNGDNYDSIFTALEFNASLINLSCSQFSFDEIVLSSMLKSLVVNSSLKTLSIKKRPLDPKLEEEEMEFVRMFEIERASELFKALRENLGITTLRLDGFDIFSSIVDPELSKVDISKEFASLIQANEKIQHITLYGEDIFEVDGGEHYEKVVEQFQKAIGRQRGLRVLRIMSHEASGERSGRKALASARTVMTEALNGAFSEAAAKRNMPLMVRLDSQEFLCGELVSEDEIGLWADWEVGDQVELIKSEKSKKGSKETKIPARVLSVQENPFESEIEKISYTLQFLDETYSIVSDVGMGNLDEPFSLGLQRGSSLPEYPPDVLSASNIMKAMGDKPARPKSKERKRGKDKKKKSDNNKDESQEKTRGRPTSAASASSNSSSSHRSNSSRSRSGSRSGSRSRSRSKDRKKTKEAQNVSPMFKHEEGDIVFVRFYGDPEWEPAQILRTVLSSNGVPSGFVEVDLVASEIEGTVGVIDETLVRAAVDPEVFPDSSVVEIDFYMKGDLVDVQKIALGGESNETEWSRGTISRKQKGGLFDVKFTDGEISKKISARNIVPAFEPNDIAIAVLGLSFAKGDPTRDFVSVQIQKRHSNGSYSVMTSDGAVMKLSPRQLLHDGRDSTLDASLQEFAIHFGATQQQLDNTESGKSEDDRSEHSHGSKNSKNSKGSRNRKKTKRSKEAKRKNTSSTNSKAKKEREREQEQEKNNLDDSYDSDKKPSKNNNGKTKKLDEEVTESPPAPKMKKTLLDAKKKEKKSKELESKLQQQLEEEAASFDERTERAVEDATQAAGKARETVLENGKYGGFVSSVPTEKEKVKVRDLFEINQINGVVEVNYKGIGKWYPARISRDRMNGTYDMSFEDGDKEDKVELSRIRILVSEIEPNSPEARFTAIDKAVADSKTSDSRSASNINNAASPRQNNFSKSATATYSKPTPPSGVRPSSHTPATTLVYEDSNNSSASVEKLMEELTMLQQIHEEEAITIRKAMNFVDSKRVYREHISSIHDANGHGDISPQEAQFISMKGQFSPQLDSMTGSVMYSSHNNYNNSPMARTTQFMYDADSREEEILPAIDGINTPKGIFLTKKNEGTLNLSSATFHDNTYNNGNVSENLEDFFKQAGSSRNNNGSTYPVPYNRRPYTTLLSQVDSLSQSQANFHDNASSTRNLKLTTRNNNLIETTYNEKPSNNKKMSYDVLTNIRLIAEQKGWVNVKQFLASVVTPEGGLSDLTHLLRKNGYDETDSLEPLLYTLAESRESENPTSHLRNHLSIGKSESELRGGHAQKLIAKFNDLYQQNQALLAVQSRHIRTH